MKLAIHIRKGSFSDRWIAYCDEKGISWKEVNCYSNDIMYQLEDCDALLWHFSQNSTVDFLLAKQLIQSLEIKGLKVFPDVKTSWHFDDKLAQKYLFDAKKIAYVDTHIFYNKSTALSWIETQKTPLIFKLRGGAGSQNVKLLKNKFQARRIIKKAFGKGIPIYDPFQNLKDRWKKYQLGKTGLWEVAKGVIRLINPPAYSKLKGREKGYVYFQEYIKDIDHDIRVVVIKNKAFAIKRMVRKKDFRASGSGSIQYDKKLFDENLIAHAFKLSKSLEMQCIAFDFILKNNSYILLEISYGFTAAGYDSCPGYWMEDLSWNEGSFNPYGWMVELALENEK